MVIGLREEGAKRRFKGANKWRRKKPLKTFFSPRQLYTLYEQKFSNLRPILLVTLPKDSEYLKHLDIKIWEVGAKRPLKGVRKCDGQTDRQTNKHTDISTYRKQRPRGTMLWKLDGTGPVHNRPSTKYLHPHVQFFKDNFKKSHMTGDTWHVTRDMWQVTCDMWQKSIICRALSYSGSKNITLSHWCLYLIHFHTHKLILMFTLSILMKNVGQCDFQKKVFIVAF